ncbi:LysE family translocator [Psychrobacter sp. YP14]|uniref:LysE family translocator n=3 Tax=Psychrobacter TaxID=497 RepID=A0A844M276_9GAMM|nr:MULTISPECIES: LysE family translocator [Psychrobacter]AWT49231.1 LysE family translocator [Psychrobacter sp. YP14]MUG32835.1 LysE family translocator [Psychrobacter sanguinis]
MFGIENYWGFLAAGLLLNLTPGADSLYIIMRSISQGSKAGVFSALGITSGILVHTLLAALGLSVLLSRHPMAFNMVKYIGALYLCYLGIRLLWPKKRAQVAEQLAEDIPSRSRDSVNGWQIYKQGVLTNVFNPKVALFFLAFFPQFIDANYGSAMLSFSLLGLSFAATSLAWCISLALLAARFSEQLRQNPRIETVLNKISGVVFIGLGIRLMGAKL